MGTKGEFYPATVHKLDVNSSGYGITSLEGLSADDEIYLAKIKNNRVRWNRSTANSGAEPGQEGSQSLAGVVATETGETFLRYERHWQVTPPPENTHSQNRTRSVTKSQFEGVTTQNFFVDMSPATNAFELKTATLRKIGTYCKVWVVEGYFEGDSGEEPQVTQEEVNKLANKFDEIYPLETYILGYEYGGGLDGNGGMDGDPQVQILLFDIDGDRSSSGGTYGYFYPGDEFARGSMYPCSNEAEIFYIDSVIFTTYPLAIYSTLIHEFNHMINFNLKVLQGGEYLSWNTEVWYTEMLSMLAEDTIGPLVGIFPMPGGSHVINQRIRSWVIDYANASVMYWPSSGNTLPYYSSNYAFGAYLMRNFGGSPLFSAIAKSPVSGRGSVDGIMRIFNGVGIDTAYAMSRFSEALLYSENKVPEGGYTFDKDAGGLFYSDGTPYTFKGFNVWSSDFSPGPLIREYAKMSEYAAPANTVQLYSDRDSDGYSAWTQEIAESGGLTIRLLNVEADADYYLITKPQG